MTTTTGMSVVVFHNLMFGRLSASRPYPGEYQAEDPAVQVFATTVPHRADPLAVCEQMFHLLNVGDDPSFGETDARAVAYRARRNRGLSISDLVQVDGAWYACAATGFTPAEPPRIVFERVPGSAPHTDVDPLPSPAAGHVDA